MNTDNTDPYLRIDPHMARMKARDQAAAELASFLAPIVHDAVTAYERAAADTPDHPAPTWQKLPAPAREDTQALVRFVIDDRHLQAPGLYRKALGQLGGLWRALPGHPGLMTRADPTPFDRLPVETRRAFHLVIHVVRALTAS